MGGSRPQKVVNLLVERDSSNASLNFTTAAGENFCFMLTRAHSIYHHRANVLLLDSNSSGTSYVSASPKSSTYISVGNNAGTEKSSAVLTFYENGDMNALILRNGEAYNLFPSRKLMTETNERTSLGKAKADMHVLSRASETWEHELASCGTKSATVGKLREGRILIQHWEQCYVGQETPRFFDIGIASDYSFFSKYGSLERVVTEIESMVAQTNLVFSAQFNVYLRISQLIVTPSNKEPETASIFKLCENDIQGRIEVFREWVRTLSTVADMEKVPVSQGIWHLVTNCHPPPGTVGIAYINQDDLGTRFGTLCSNTEGTNTGISSVTPTPWLTFAHEIGHNFGARHSFEKGQGKTGGIMDYGSGMFNGEYQFISERKDEICPELEFAIHSTACDYKRKSHVGNFFSEFHPDCKNITSMKSCDAGICRSGICIPRVVELLVSNSLLNYMAATFNPTIDFQNPVTYSLVLSNPQDACSSLIGNGFVGKYVLVDMNGNCSYFEKTINAQNSGAVGILVGNLEQNLNPELADALIVMDLENDEKLSDVAAVKIPALFISNIHVRTILENENNDVTYGYLGDDYTTEDAYSVIQYPRNYNTRADVQIGNGSKGSQAVLFLCGSFLVLLLCAVVKCTFFRKNDGDPRNLTSSSHRSRRRKSLLQKRKQRAKHHAVAVNKQPKITAFSSQHTLAQ